MAMPRTNPRWVRRIDELAAEGKGRRQVARIIEEEAAREGTGDYPKEATVGRIMRTVKSRAPEVRWLDEPFCWPDSMEALGWELGQVGLDLTQHRLGHGRGRPTNRTVRWA